MKENELKFARLVSYVSAIGGTSLSEYDIEGIHALLPSPPLQEPARIDAPNLIAFMDDLARGDKKIDCIRWFRSFTGWGLKESKDAIEAHYAKFPPKKDSNGNAA